MNALNFCFPVHKFALLLQLDSVLHPVKKKERKDAAGPKSEEKRLHHQTNLVSQNLTSRYVWRENGAVFPPI